MGEKEVLLKIYRNYSKEESIKYFENIISDLKMEIGMLKSEVSELRDLKKPKEIDMHKAAKCYIHSYIKEFQPEIHNQIKNLNNKLALSRKNVVKWREKYFNLLARHNKLLENEQV